MHYNRGLYEQWLIIANGIKSAYLLVCSIPSNPGFYYLDSNIASNGVVKISYRNPIFCVFQD
jgi:hypothetical protein